MAVSTQTRIPLQVGSELRFKRTGEIAISNPTLELAPSDVAADAVLSHRFDAHTGEHVIRLEEPWSATHRVVDMESPAFGTRER